VALLLLVGFGALGLAARGDGARLAVVSVGRDVVAELRLDRPGTYPVDGRRGPVVLEVRGGAIRVRESDCPHGICRAMGEKDRSGQIIACVPNGVLIRLVGGRPDPREPDAVSR